MKIITLCREYGAGGHSIGRKVASELGIEIYDRDIIEQSAAALGIDPGQLEAEEEGISRRETFLRAITPISYERKDAMYDAECAVIRDLAKKGPCVFLGRCADAVLQEAGIDCFRVFLSEIQKALRKTDQARRSYYTHYTGRTWGDHTNFHLCLDTGVLGYDNCVKLICEAVRGMEE